MRSERIKGIELANGVLLPLLFLQDLSLGLRASSDFISRYDLHIIGDGAIAGFCFLIGLSAGRPPAPGEGHKEIIKYHYLRGFALITAGLLLAFFWPSGLLVLLGLLSLLATLLRKLPTFILLLLGCVIFIVFTFSAFRALPLVNVNPYNAETIRSVIGNLWSGGYYGLLHWILFTLFGLLYSRLRFLSKGHSVLSSTLASGLLILAFIAEYALGKLANTGNPFIQRPFAEELFVHMHPLTFLLAAGALIVLGLNLCITLNDRAPRNILFMTLRRYGRSRYSVLLAQALTGIGIMVLQIEAVNSFSTLTLASLLLSAIFMFFVYLWSNSHDLGPVEWSLRTLTRKK